MKTIISCMEPIDWYLSLSLSPPLSSFTFLGLFSFSLFLGSFWCKIKISLPYKSNMSKFPVMNKTDGVISSARAVDLQEWLRAFRCEWVNPLERVGPQPSLMRDFCSQLWYFRRGITKGLLGKTLPTVRHIRLKLINSVSKLLLLKIPIHVCSKTR